MNRRTFIALTAGGALPGQEAKPRLRRADSFFGLHFDLHPNENDKALGRDVSEDMVERILAIARPDYVQYDAKGHPGWLGWPSQVGPSAPGIVVDSLAVYRKVTARHGVALYIHFSGVWDSHAVKHHPAWARRDEKNRPSDRQTSTFGPYVDELMLPQLTEAATLYKLDGAWVDGECWATNPDYSPAALDEWKRASGTRKAPRSSGDPRWQEWLEFQRQRFRDYVRHYVDVLHRNHPRFQIASNWLYSTLVPEEPVLPVDFLSGDYLGNASISQARMESRYLAQTGKPWDLMAWGFQQANSNAVGHVHKPVVQLQQEACVVLAQGGGFQVYYVPSRTGWFDEKHIAVMGELSKFCRSRQAVCHKSETVPQIGVIFSGHSLYRTANKLFGGWGRASDPARGMVDALLTCQWSVDVIPDWKLAKAARTYPFLVLPDWADPGQETDNSLLDFVRNGGRLLIAGAANAERWSRHVGYKTVARAAEQQTFVVDSEVFGNAKGLWLDLDPGTTELLASRYPALDTRGGGKPAAVGARVGSGEVVVVPGPLGNLYSATHAPALRDFIKRLVAPGFQPLVEVSGPPTVEVVLRRQRGELVVHLLNSTAMQVAGDYAAIDYVPVVGPISLRFTRAEPTYGRIEPGGQDLKPDGRVVRIDRLHLHTAILFKD